jgi:MFS family permease
MNMEIGTERTPRLFYGWWIVAAGCVIVAYGVGISGYVTGNLFSLMDGAANQTSIAIGIFSFVAAITVLATGPLIDRYGPRKLMLIGVPIAGIALLGLSFSDSLPYIYLGVLAIGTSAGFLLPVQTATANWFMKRRSVSLAVVCAAPEPRAIQEAELGKVIEIPEVGGLHHHYERRAA